MPIHSNFTGLISGQNDLYLSVAYCVFPLFNLVPRAMPVRGLRLALPPSGEIENRNS